MTSNAQLIYDKLAAHFPHALKTITELSYNDGGKRNFIVSDEIGFDYDQVQNCSPCYEAHQKEKSPDALFCVGDKLYFIEFKDGKHDKNDIRLKIHEGVTTLYMFVREHLPVITRAEFVELDINYAVIARRDARHRESSFQAALIDTSRKYNLKNIEGLLVKNTRFTSDPSLILNLLHKLTLTKLTSIQIFEGPGDTQTFSI
ncbi:hypothetical protein E5198_07215 [Pseudomonas sp. A-1]|uniref:hypothetical protein n=1 Tax=Pseudomonas sp. A-1 TaxID=1821274 RepID=UPI0010A61A6A|nr:hypothetical protein [Pseudomonas sp. A-1]THG83482.1 hypothetical protein E5198_07215 [Pseudomonas sp. A-1]